MPKASLQLIVRDLRLTSAGAAADSSPHLSRIAGRGSRVRLFDSQDLQLRRLQIWQHSLLHALHLEAIPYASAPTTAFGMQADVSAPARYWLHADPVHLVAGLDHLSLLPLPDAAKLAPAEQTELEFTLHAHLQTHAFEMAGTSRGWLIRSPRPLELTTTAPNMAAANPLEQAMPSGQDAGEIRRLMTELQMLLHDHPVNTQRARRGLPVVNALWFWGNGVLQTTEISPVQPALGVAYSDESYVRGIYLLHSQTCEPAPPHAQALLAAAEGSDSSAVAVIKVSGLGELEEQWLAPLSAALSEGRLRELAVYVDGWRCSLTRGESLRFWRKARSPQEWLN